MGIHLFKIVEKIDDDFLIKSFLSIYESVILRTLQTFSSFYKSAF